MAVKTANLINLQRQLDLAFPKRKGPDGWIGNDIHWLRISGHNPDDTPGSKPAWDGDPDSIAEVRALDVAADLGDPDVTSTELVRHLVALPGIATVFRYFIHKGFIYHVRDGYNPVAFDGDPHAGHIHAEGAWTQAADNNSTFDFRLDDLVSLSAADKTWLISTIDARLKAWATVDPIASIYKRTGYSANEFPKAFADGVAALTSKIDMVSAQISAASHDGPVTQEQVTAAFEQALRKAFAAE